MNAGGIFAFAWLAVCLAAVAVAVAVGRSRSATELLERVSRALEEYGGQARETRDLVRRQGDSLISMVASVNATIPHFVCVLVEGVDDKGARINMGKGVVLRPNDRPLELAPYVPIFDGRVTVFADLARVAVDDIFVGADRCGAGPGDCPSVRFAEILPGMKITINVRVRS